MEQFPIIPRVTGCLFLTGPTASGKTAASIEIARRINAEIISLDSMAIYRKMDIGTAKPTLEERDGIEHHMIDIIEPFEEYSLAAYVVRVAEIAEQIKARGHKVLFAGGTPLYLKGVLRGLFDGPPADSDFREKLEQEEQETGIGYLHMRLEEVDPKTALRLHPNDKRRIIRALEVYEKTGYPISYFQQQHERPAAESEALVYVIDRPREELYDRINRRVDLMLEQGLEQEALSLFESDPPPGKTARQAVGYREFFDFFEGKSSREEAVELIKQHSRNFAKSQGTWFRSLPECHFVSPEESAQLF